MQKDVLEQIEKVQKTTLESVKRLGEINARALERMAQHQLNVASAYMESNVKQFQALGEAKGMQDMVSVQSQAMSELNKALVGHAKQTVDILTETKNEFVAWVEEGMEAAKESPVAAALTSKSA